MFRRVPLLLANPSRLPSLSASQFNHQCIRSIMTRERVIVVGTGWAGFQLSQKLDDKKFDIVVISPEETSPYTPLLVCFPGNANLIMIEANITILPGKCGMRPVRFLPRRRARPPQESQNHLLQSPGQGRRLQIQDVQMPIRLR